MSKLLKIIGRCAGISAEWILILFLLLAFAIRTYPVQTYIAKKTALYLSNELQTEIRIEAVEIIFFDQVLLKEFHVKDKQNKVLFDMNEIHVTLNQFALFKDPLNIKKAKLSNGEVNISRHPVSGEYNFQFIADYFEQDKDPDSEPTIFGIDNVELNNVDFNYDDYRIPKKDFGIDYNHIGITNLNLNIGNFKIQDDAYTFDIGHISCSEKSGLELKDFSSIVFINEGKIQLDELNFNMGSSHILADYFSLDFDTWDDFNAFKDQVNFDANIDSSVVSLKDVSFFVDELKGMNELIAVKGKD